MMETTKLCQSCAMPLNNPEDYGTEKDGSKSGDYCHYCFANGEFASDETMEQMVESCVGYAVEDGTYSTAEEARAAMMEFYPKLKRWAKN